LFDSRSRTSAISSNGRDFLAVTANSEGVLARVLRADGAHLSAGPAMKLAPPSSMPVAASVTWNGGAYFIAWRSPSEVSMTHSRPDGSYDPIVSINTGLAPFSAPFLSANTLGIEIIVIPEVRGLLTRAVVYTFDEVTSRPPPPSRRRAAAR